MAASSSRVYGETSGSGVANYYGVKAGESVIALSTAASTTSGTPNVDCYCAGVNGVRQGRK